MMLQGEECGADLPVSTTGLRAFWQHLSDSRGNVGLISALIPGALLVTAVGTCIGLVQPGFW